MFTLPLLSLLTQFNDQQKSWGNDKTRKWPKYFHAVFAIKQAIWIFPNYIANRKVINRDKKPRSHTNRPDPTANERPDVDHKFYQSEPWLILTFSHTCTRHQTPWSVVPHSHQPGGADSLTPVTWPVTNESRSMSHLFSIFSPAPATSGDNPPIFVCINIYRPHREKCPCVSFSVLYNHLTRLK